MNKQRIILTDNDELVIITDNGRQTKDNCTTEVKGVFTISAEDAVKLFGLINNRKVLYKSLNTSGEFSWLFPNCNTIIVDKREDIGIIGTLKKELQSKEKLLINKDEEIREFYSLKKQIKEFNEGRRWWERKLMIKE